MPGFDVTETSVLQKNQLTLMQTTSNILLVRPARFMFKPQTETSNAFQKKSIAGNQRIQEKAHVEFESSSFYKIEN